MRVSRGYMLACAAAVVVGITLLVLTFAETVYGSSCSRTMGAVNASSAIL